MKITGYLFGHAYRFETDSGIGVEAFRNRLGDLTDEVTVIGFDTLDFERERTGGPKNVTTAHYPNEQEISTDRDAENSAEPNEGDSVILTGTRQFEHPRTVLAPVPNEPGLGLRARTGITLAEFHEAWNRSRCDAESYIGKEAKNSAMVQSMAAMLGLK